MKVKYLLVAAAVLMICGAIYAFSEFNRKAEDLADAKVKQTVAAAEIIEAFAKDEHAANQKFLGQIIAVKGSITNIEPDSKGCYTLVLGGATSSLSAVRCAMDSVHNDDVKNLEKGMQVTVKGNVTGYQADDTGLLGSDVELNRCVIDSKK